MYYHKQASIYGFMLKRLQRKHVLLWSANAVFAFAGTAAGANVGPIAITIASASALLIGYIVTSDIQGKISQCKFAPDVR